MSTSEFANSISSDSASTAHTRPADPSTAGLILSPRWLRGAAAVRIAFGVLWAIDATFKWLPGFIHGQTLGDELGKAPSVSLPIEHQWLVLWNAVGTAAPSAFAVGIAIVETIAAVLLILGLFTRTALIGTALLSAGIWTGAEGMHLPWNKPGQTDLGPSVGYIFGSLGLFFAAAGEAWSVDALLRRRRLVHHDDAVLRVH